MSQPTPGLRGWPLHVVAPETFHRNLDSERQAQLERKLERLLTDPAAPRVRLLLELPDRSWYLYLATRTPPAHGSLSHSALVLRFQTETEAQRFAQGMDLAEALPDFMPEPAR